MAEIALHEVTRQSVWPIMTLEVGEDQGHLVAPNRMSIAEADYEPKAWFRAIYADEVRGGENSLRLELLPVECRAAG